MNAQAMPLNPPSAVFFDWHGTLVNYTPQELPMVPACAPVPGTLDVLKALKQKRVPMGLVSNEYTETLHQHLKVLGWADYFPVVVGAGSTPYAKPAPEPLLYGIKEMSRLLTKPLKPEEVWFVGDTPSDVLCALRVGCVSVYVAPYQAGGEKSHLHIKSMQKFVDFI